MRNYILACDQGTSSTRSLLIDRNVNSLAIHQIAVKSENPHTGWVEQDAELIWQTQLSTIQKILDALPKGAREIAAIGIANQRETTVVWDRRSGIPIAPAIIWQCRRTDTQCAELASNARLKELLPRTGLTLDPYFSATKIAWILDHVADARLKAENGEALFGTIDSWLMYKFTGHQSHVIDRTNASRTMLMDLDTSEWSPELLNIFGIPAEMMPQIIESSGELAITSGDLLGDEIPISGIAGDQQAALFGQNCWLPGDVKATYGTGCFTLMNTGEKRVRSKHNLIATAAAVKAGEAPQYALEGSVFTAGAVVQWLRDQLGLFLDSAETHGIATSVKDTDGVYFVPAFTGLGAPYWRSDVRGAISGLTANTSKAHLIRSALESIAFQNNDLIRAFAQDLDQPIEFLKVDGGAAINDFLLQFQADISGIPVIRPQNLETTALGAAYLAGLSVGFWTGREQLKNKGAAEKVFEPNISEDQRQEQCSNWNSAVAKLLAKVD